jgi:hypothetical protein
MQIEGVLRPGAPGLHTPFETQLGYASQNPGTQRRKPSLALRASVTAHGVCLLPRRIRGWC